MLLAIEILGILLMLTIMFVSIWGFILMHRIFNQLRYKNYLTEKLVQNVYMISKKFNSKDKKELKDEKSELRNEDFDIENSTAADLNKSGNTFQEKSDL